MEKNRKRFDLRVFSAIIVIFFVFFTYSGKADASYRLYGCSEEKFCTLDELLGDPITGTFNKNYIQVGDPPYQVKFGGFGISGYGEVVSDPTKIKVIPLDDIYYKPGLRFEPIGDIWNIEAEPEFGLDGFNLAEGSWDYYVQSNLPDPVQITGISYSVDAFATLLTPADPNIIPCEITSWPYWDIGEGSVTSGGIAAWAGFLFSDNLVIGNWSLPPGANPGNFSLVKTLAFDAGDTPQETIKVSAGFSSFVCDDTDTAYSQGAETRSIEVRILLLGRFMQPMPWLPLLLQQNNY